MRFKVGPVMEHGRFFPGVILTVWLLFAAPFSLSAASHPLVVRATSALVDSVFNAARDRRYQVPLRVEGIATTPGDTGTTLNADFSYTGTLTQLSGGAEGGDEPWIQISARFEQVVAEGAAEFLRSGSPWSTGPVRFELPYLNLSVLAYPTFTPGSISLNLLSPAITFGPVTHFSSDNFPEHDVLLQTMINLLIPALSDSINAKLTEHVNQAVLLILNGVGFERPFSQFIDTELFFKPIVYRREEYEVRNRAERVDLDRYWFGLVPNRERPLRLGRDTVSLHFDTEVLTREVGASSAGDVDPVMVESPDLPTTQSPGSPLALAIHVDLINSILSTIYKDGLLNLTAYFETALLLEPWIDSKLPQEFKTYFEIDPQAAPRIWYDTSLVSIAAENVIVQVGLYIKDRPIPSFRLRARGALESELGLDRARNTVVLRMKDRSAMMALEKVDGSISDQMLEILQEMVHELLLKYFRSRPTLDLFPTLLNLQQFAIALRSIEVVGPYLVMHLDLDFGLSESRGRNGDVILLPPSGEPVLFHGGSPS